MPNAPQPFNSIAHAVSMARRMGMIVQHGDVPLFLTMPGRPWYPRERAMYDYLNDRGCLGNHPIDRVYVAMLRLR